MKPINNVDTDVALEDLEDKIKYLIDFLNNIQDLDDLKAEIGFNVFETLSIINAEEKHSNVLAWLLNPNETHGLDDYFLKEFVKAAYQNNQNTVKDLRPEVFYLWDYAEAEVFREKHRIDILVVDKSNTFVLAIENKIDSKEHDNQLGRYKEYVYSEYPNHNKMFLYLTKTGEEASDHDTWGSFSYEIILNDLLEGCIRRASLKAKSFIEDYQTILRRYIVGDNKLEEMCRKIYFKHKKALDLIFEYKPDLRFEISTYLRDLVINTEGITENQSTKTMVKFSDEILDSINNKHRNVAGRWVEDKSVILHEFKVKDDHISLSTVVGPTEDSTRERIIRHYTDKGYKLSNRANKFTVLKTTKIILIAPEDDMDAIIDKIDKNIHRKLKKHIEIIDSVFEDYG